MNDVNRNIALGQPFHLPAKRNKRPQAAIPGIIKISCDYKEIRLRRNGVIDDGLKSAQRRRLQGLSKAGIGIRKAAKGAVQVQIRRMDKSDGIHA
jgi:hypothetical protein